MIFPLDTFEQFVHPDFLTLGSECYRDKKVTSLKEVTKGEYIATVKGMSGYEITVSVHKGIVERWDCDCSYHLGPVCKHVIAVLFALRNRRLKEEKR